MHGSRGVHNFWTWKKTQFTISQIDIWPEHEMSEVEVIRLDTGRGGWRVSTYEAQSMGG